MGSFALADSLFQEPFNNPHSVDTGLDQIDWCVNLGSDAVTMNDNTRIGAPSALLKGFVFPSVIFNPGPEYGSDALNYQGIPGMDRAPGGRRIDGFLFINNQILINNGPKNRIFKQA